MNGRYFVRNNQRVYDTGIPRSPGWHTLQLGVTYVGAYTAMDGRVFDNLFVNTNFKRAHEVGIEYPWSMNTPTTSYWDDFRVIDRMYAITVDASGTPPAPVTGTYARIEVADPETLNSHSLETSWITDGTHTIEFGWMKTDSMPPTYYAYATNFSERPGQYLWYGPAPCCGAHEFVMWHDDANSRWGLYLDGVWKDTLLDTGFTGSYIVQYGGEVVDRRNHVGTSGLLDLKYWYRGGTSWQRWSGAGGSDLGYWISPLWGTLDNWQNGTTY